jgi:hypothetical protein
MEEDSSFKVLMGKPIGKRPIGKPRCRWEKNFRMDLKEIGINTRKCVASALLNAALNLRFP